MTNSSQWVFIGVASSGQIFLCIWPILGERQFVSRKFVRVTHCFRTSEIQLPEVVRAVWQSSYFGGSLVLIDSSHKVEIQFLSVRSRERLELIGFFRTTISQDIQEGWERFDFLCVPASATSRQRHDEICNRARRRSE
jgi:hypothetical protein